MKYTAREIIKFAENNYTPPTLHRVLSKFLLLLMLGGMVAWNIDIWFEISTLNIYFQVIYFMASIFWVVMSIFISKSLKFLYLLPAMILTLIGAGSENKENNDFLYIREAIDELVNESIGARKNSQLNIT